MIFAQVAAFIAEDGRRWINGDTFSATGGAWMPCGRGSLVGGLSEEANIFQTFICTYVFGFYRWGQMTLALRIT